MKNKKVWISVAAIALIAALAGLGYWYYISNFVKSWNYKVYPGVKVESVDLGGKTKEEAIKLIKQNHSELVNNKKIIVKTPEKAYELSYSKLNPQFNIDEVVGQAFEYGKNQGAYAKYKLIREPKEKDIKMTFKYDAKAVDNLVSQVEKDVNKEMVNAKLNFNGGSFSVKPEQKGAKLKKDKLQQDMVASINAEDKKDAEITAEIDVVEPTVTAEKLNTINAPIASYSTNYGSISTPERASNISIATRTINGTLLMPGDTFSFNDKLGKRTAEKGYKPAHVIVNNQVIDDFGGGICQVSSTLYNAVLKAGMKASERTHHTIPSTYVSLGMDATVDYGNIDFKFKNTLEYPVYIASSTAGGATSFTIYSNSSLKNKSYDVYNEVYATVPSDTQYVDDPSMPAGQTETVQKAYNGYKVKVYRKVSENGNVINTETISDDYYLPIKGKIKRGTKQ